MAVVDAYLYDAEFVRVGKLPVVECSAILRHNDISTFEIDVNADSEMWSGLPDAGHIALFESGKILISGYPTKTGWKRSSGETTFSITCNSHDAYLDSMITIPDPSRPVDSQGGSAYYTARGKADDLIHDMVRTHIGQDAREENSQPVHVEDSPGDGKTVSVKTRFKPLLETIQGLAESGNIAFRVIKVGHETVFSSWQPRDLTRNIRLTENNGGITDFSLEQDAPETTRVLVAGQGEGKERTLRHMTGNDNMWGIKRLVFQDRRDTDETDELEQAGLDTLEEAAESAGITMELADTAAENTDAPRFGRDFTVGDRITVNPEKGARVRDIVREAEVTWGEEGREIKLTVGPERDDQKDKKLVAEVRRLRRELRTIQTR